LLDAVGETKATILSAYRTAETNSMLARTTFGVAEHSQHITGRALDIRLESKLSDAMTRARAMQRGGVGWYPHSGFIHIDTGPIRNWTLDERGLDGLLIFDGRRLRLDGTSQGLLGGPWRPLTVAQRLTLQHQLARAEIPLGPPHRSSRQPVMAAQISLPTPQVTAPITIDQALVRCFPVAATRWLSSHWSAGNLEPNHRDRRCLR
jgi:hypothetical protein